MYLSSDLVLQITAKMFWLMLIKHCWYSWTITAYIPDAP
jgi:hypothetical protein